MSIKSITSLLQLFSARFFSLVVFVLCTGLCLVVFSSLSGRLSASKSVLNKNGHYAIQTPILISHAPKIFISKGTVRFEKETNNNKQSNLSTHLPFNWINGFVSNEFTHISLDDAVITIDFRGTMPKAETLKGSPQAPQLVYLPLKKSELESLALTNSKLVLLRDFSHPINLQINEGEFDIDLSDEELSGKGLLTLNKRQTAFNLTHDFSDKNSKGTLLNKVSLTLQNKLFETNFNGVIEGRRGLYFNGKTSFNFKDITQWELWPVLEVPSPKDHRAIRFAGDGLLQWSGAEGTLTNGDFKIGQNAATGSLSLKLSQTNPEASGTLAFESLDFSDLYTTKRRKKTQSNVAGLEDVDQTLIDRIKVLTPLIRDYDADLRISANRIVINDIQLKEAGFSLFQKKGELLIDMAGASLFQGAASGLIKIDTNSPKPRLHVNAGFTNVDMGKFSDALPNQSLFKGLGHLKLKLTSYGDKGQEIYENMFGSLNFTMPQGGEINLKLEEFLGEQEASSKHYLKALTDGTSKVTKISSLAHFSKGAIVFDHFMISTKKNDFTGRGFLNLKTMDTNWDIASWDLSDTLASSAKSTAEVDKKSAPEQVEDKVLNETSNDENDNEQNEGLARTPILLTCSHITGHLDKLLFEKFTALHLSLLNKACPAFYHFDQLKTKDTPIVQSDNAG